MFDFGGKKYTVVTYGCQMNLHESEKIAGILENMGFIKADDIENSDIVVFNTCCIRDTAERRALGNIGKLKQLKRRNKNMLLVVVGCMTQQKGFAENFKARYDYVDIVLGTHNISELEDKIIERISKRKRIAAVYDCDGYIDDETTPLSRTSYPNAWVNINYGCNNFCTYCIVPYVRGRERSRDTDSIVAECERLVKEGYGEITLLGQNVNSYGSDLPDGSNFAALLQRVADIDGKFRIRFMTSHPKDLTREVVETIKNNDKICNNIHLPVQAGSNDVLKNMNRRYTREHYLGLLEMIREILGGGVGITSDIMVGFPMETEKDFEDTLDLTEKARFSTAFTFIYSVRKGTKAAEMPQLPYEVKQDRIKRLIELQNNITAELSENYIGNVYEVLIEGLAEKKKGYVCGRTESGRLVNVGGGAELIGKFKNVLIREARHAALYGDII